MFFGENIFEAQLTNPFWRPAKGFSSLCQIGGFQGPKIYFQDWRVFGFQAKNQQYCGPKGPTASIFYEI